MLQPRIAARLGRKALDLKPTQLYCEHRALDRSKRLAVQHFSSPSVLRLPARNPNEQQPPPKEPKDTPEPPTPQDTKTAKDEEAFVPKPLGRPIGFSQPPQSGENTGTTTAKKDYSGMSLKERHLAKRRDLVEKWSSNYFRDFKNIRKYRSGKTFLANPRIFKKAAAMYFPNFRGNTLEKSNADTTDVIQGKVSVVNIYSSAWGEAQVKTFTGRQENPELSKVIEENAGLAQQVDINIEENSVKAWIVGMFAWRMRLMRKKEDWGKYFVVRRGVSGLIRESIGLLNGRVGYVYLVDADCKIRWAGSANAEDTEKDDLVRGLKRVIEEEKTRTTA